MLYVMMVRMTVLIIYWCFSFSSRYKHVCILGFHAVLGVVIGKVKIQRYHVKFAFIILMTSASAGILASNLTSKSSGIPPPVPYTLYSSIRHRYTDGQLLVHVVSYVGHVTM